MASAGFARSGGGKAGQAKVARGMVGTGGESAGSEARTTSPETSKDTVREPGKAMNGYTFQWQGQGEGTIPQQRPVVAATAAPAESSLGPNAQPVANINQKVDSKPTVPQNRPVSTT